MAFGGVVLFVIVHITLVWLVTNMKKSRYKILAFFLIALSIFGYISFNLAFEGREADLTDFKGVAEASGIYFSWLSSAFGNAQAITSRVIDSDSNNDTWR